MWAAGGAAHATGAARRRTERDASVLYMRYARMSVAMALAESNHHTAPTGTERGQGRGGLVRDAPHGEDPEAPPSQPEVFELFHEELGGARPDRLAGVRSQERVQRHTAEHVVETYSVLPEEPFQGGFSHFSSREKVRTLAGR